MTESADGIQGYQALRDLAHTFTVELTQTLTHLGVWPRPARSRRLEYGVDFRYAEFSFLPSFSRLNGWLSNHELLGARYPVADGSLTAAMWIRLVLKVLESSSASVDQRVFDGVFRSMWQELCAQTASLRWVTALAGVKLSAELPLDDANRLVPMVRYPELVEELLKGQLPYESVEFDPRHFRALLITEMTVAKTDPAWKYSLQNSGQDAQRELALAALRLYSPGVAKAAHEYRVQLGVFPLIEPTADYVGEHGNDPTPDYGDAWCELTAEDAEGVRQVWSRLLRGWHGEEENARLSVALDRFMRSFEDKSRIENIVDLTIALEALLAPQGTHDELTHRFRMRSAFLLGRNDQEAARIYGVADAMYNLRSRILHGERLKDSEFAKWIGVLADEPVNLKQGLAGTTVPRAIAASRVVVRRLIAGALKLLLDGDGGTCTWPLPKSFDLQCNFPSAKAEWTAAFFAPLQDVPALK